MKLFDAIRMSETELNTCWDKIIAHLTTHNQQYLISKLGKVPPVIWSKFGFHVAGRYCWTPQKDKIEMNTNFLNINNPEEFVISTMRHEAAHCINNRIGSGGNHDKMWKVIATILGDDANIYHNYERPSNAPVRQVTIHEFHCTCGQSSLYAWIDSYRSDCSCYCITSSDRRVVRFAEIQCSAGHAAHLCRYCNDSQA
jgi:predicted SprT family Zn-dependent metalloprotease